jgi:hypothetical protein
VPALKNPRYEKFALGLFEGKTADEAYAVAGYKPNRGNATTLKANQSIIKRLRELQDARTERTLVTVDSLTDELEEARAMALSEKQSSAAVAATMGKAKLHGLVIDKKQLTGARGGPVQIADLSRLKGMTTEELQVLDRALVQIGIAEGDQDGTGKQED